MKVDRRRYHKVVEPCKEHVCHTCANGNGRASFPCPYHNMLEPAKACVSNVGGRCYWRKV